jgi:hypothetical protein
MKYQKHIFITLAMSWGALGFKRGLNSYDYKHKKYSTILVNNSTYLYTFRIMDGIMGTLIYLMPVFLPITVTKEIFRLEVNLRNLEQEKTRDYYNDII